LHEAALFLASQNLAVAERFLVAAQQCFDELAKSPDLGFLAEFESVLAAGVRRWRIKGFKNYLVFYRPSQIGVEIIRVIHGARDIESLFEIVDE
jgi:toxin ParE1/3/4